MKYYIVFCIAIILSISSCNKIEQGTVQKKWFDPKHEDDGAKTTTYYPDRWFIIITDTIDNKPKRRIVRIKQSDFNKIQIGDIVIVDSINWRLK